MERHEHHPEPAGIDVERVTEWLVQYIDGLEAPFHFDLVAGGHSCLTFVVTDASGRRIVLRRPPVGTLLASAHDVVREHRIISALGPTPVPVPETLAVCHETDVTGAPFFVMDHVDGVVLHDADSVDAAIPDAAARVAVADSLIDALAALHSVDVDRVGLGDLSRRSGYVDRQLKRWSAQWEAARTRDVPEMTELHRWLVDHRPDEAPSAIVHGDFRLGNVLIRRDGSVAAILDWELCTLGDPIADIAYLLRSWTLPGEEAGSHLVPPTTAGGFPDRDVLVARYSALTGRDLGSLDYWYALIAWRSAAISEGVLRRYLDGKMGGQPFDEAQFRSTVDRSVSTAIESARRQDPASWA